MTTMKRVSTALLAFMMVSLALSFPVLAQQDEMIVVYIKAPADWQSPCIWAWDDEGNNAFDAWPGGETLPDENNEGWVYCWIPVWADNIIINANGGEVQTGDRKLEGKNTWITIESAEIVEVTYETMTQGSAPAHVEMLTVYAKAPEAWEAVNLWAWSHPDGTNAFSTWPGEPMKLGDDGWYSIKAPVWINAVIINAGEGNDQTEDITVEAKDMWITIGENEAEVAYENPDQSAAENIRVSVTVPADWDNPCLWAWSHPDGTNAFTDWPGEPLQPDGNWQAIEVPGWINSVIVNGNDGTIQTEDIAVDTGKDIWIQVLGETDYILTYEEPDVTGNAPEPVSQEPETSKGTDSVPVVVIILITGGIVVAAIVIIIVARRRKTRN